MSAIVEEALCRESLRGRALAYSSALLAVMLSYFAIFNPCVKGNLNIFFICKKIYTFVDTFRLIVPAENHKKKPFLGLG